MQKTLIKGIKVDSSKDEQDVLIENDLFSKISAHIDVQENDAVVIDGKGKVLLPHLIDGHGHIDKTLWGLEWFENEVPRELSKIVENERKFRASHQLDSHAQSMRMTQKCLQFGTGAIRTHIDVDNEIGTKHVEGVLETKRKFEGLVKIETVCFPQSGLLQRAGTLALMDASMALGCDYVGGIDPSSFERDPVKHLDMIFSLADKYGTGVDLHLHEPGDLGAFSVELLIERTKALSMQGKVTISHGFCLGDVELAYQHQLAEQLGANQIHVATVVPSNRNPIPFELLRSHGVQISAGNDGIRDTWSPYGTGDMLQRAMFTGLKYRWRKDSEFTQALYAITEGGARMMGLSQYGIQAGNPANFMIVQAENFIDAIVSQPAQRDVYSRGQRVVSQGQLEVSL
ncbi:amidohydrolase [Vibrio sp.]|uniref:amidohydrolase n=1 Tax=Vibrio sp. TaxID=678 RepID=UPI003D152CF7